MTGSIRIFEKLNFTPKLSVLAFLKVKLPNMTDWPIDEIIYLVLYILLFILIILLFLSAFSNAMSVSTAKIAPFFGMMGYL